MRNAFQSWSTKADDTQDRQLNWGLGRTVLRRSQNILWKCVDILKVSWGCKLIILGQFKFLVISYVAQRAADELRYSQGDHWIRNVSRQWKTYSTASSELWYLFSFFLHSTSSPVLNTNGRKKLIRIPLYFIMQWFWLLAVCYSIHHFAASWILLPNMDWYSVVGVCCRIWIDIRHLEFTAEYGLIFSSHGFHCRIWIENPSGCKLDMEAQRGIIKQKLKFCLSLTHILMRKKSVHLFQK